MPGREQRRDHVQRHRLADRQVEPVVAGEAAVAVVAVAEAEAVADDRHHAAVAGVRLVVVQHLRGPDAEEDDDHDRNRRPDDLEQRVAVRGRAVAQVGGAALAELPERVAHRHDHDGEDHERDVGDRDEERVVVLRLLRSLGGEPRHGDEQGRQDDAQHRPEDDELNDAFHRRSFRTRDTPWTLQPSEPVGDESFVRFATVPAMGAFSSAVLAPIRTKFALACAFAALITPCTLATAAGARSAGASGRPGGVCDTVRRPRRSAARGRRGGRRERGLGGRKAQGGARRERPPARARLACRRERGTRRDVVGGRDHLPGRRAERRRRAAEGGQRRQRRDDRRARPGLRRREPAERAGRQRAAAARAPAPPLVRRGLRARRARLQQQQLAARRVRVRDRLRHGAGRRPTGSSTTTRPTSSARPSTTSRTSSGRRSSCTPTRSCSARSTARAGSRRRSTPRRRPGSSGSTRRATTAPGTGRAPGATPTATATSTCPATATPSGST